MRRSLLTTVGILALLGAIGTAQAAGDAQAGKAKAAGCAGCHGANGQGSGTVLYELELNNNQAATVNLRYFGF